VWVPNPGTQKKKKINVTVLAYKDENPTSKPTTTTKENQECGFCPYGCVYACIKT
jgi:hypothetical protein